ncbi:hypothetical protein AAY80_153 [Stenotrophomonas phage vB_SmaS-DLP_6]|nr:hypothetical protein AAY80_153 [Stenotrophomonas phage vB_SmaS-DLP_6]
MVKLPKAVYERLQKYAAEGWSGEEREELYEDAVTCGNADDSFSYGETQGAADVAEEVLSYVVE